FPGAQTPRCWFGTWRIREANLESQRARSSSAIKEGHPMRPGARRLFSVLFLSCALVLGLACAGAAEPGLTKTDLFEAGKGGYFLYRIPGVVVTSKGTVLAYCEGRKKTGGDWDAIDILLRRSTDGGKTWSEPRPVAAVEGKVVKNPIALKLSQVKADDVTIN